MTENFLTRLIGILPRPLRRHKVVTAASYLFPQWKIATFSFNDSAIITADLADAAARQVLIVRTFEPEFFSIAKPFLIPGSAFFDVGANHGFCTFGLMSQRQTAERIEFHLFEANRHLCETLKLSGQNYPEQSVYVNHACVSDRSGRSKLHIIKNHWGGSFICNEESGEEVDNIILDEYIERRKVSLVSFLKMDIEGYEIHCLRGLESSIRKGIIGAMYIECSAENLKRQGSEPSELLKLLHNLGCGCFWCKPADFESGLASAAREVLLGNGSTLSIRLAPIENFPTGHQTDILAIPATGLYGHLLHEFSG